MHGHVLKAAAGAAPDPDRASPGDPGAGAPRDFSHPDHPPSDAAPSDYPRSGSPADTPSNPPPGIQILRLADRDATLRRATGSADARVHGWLVNDLSFALSTPPALEAPGFDGSGVDNQARADRVCAAVSAMCDIGPRDTLEGMLAVQMVAVHSAALDSLRRAAEAGAADRAREADLRHAARLLNVFQRQMRVRDDRRNPVLARSLTGRHAPDAAGGPPALRVAPARDAVPARGAVAEQGLSDGPTGDFTERGEGGHGEGARRTPGDERVYSRYVGGGGPARTGGYGRDRGFRPFGCMGLFYGFWISGPPVG